MNNMNKRAESGSILLEALIAILIFSAGILAIIGLQAASMKSTTQAKARVDASLIASQRLGEIWTDIPGQLTDGAQAVSLTSLPNGTLTTTINGDLVTITVTWRMPGETADNAYATIARVNTNP